MNETLGFTEKYRYFFYSHSIIIIIHLHKLFLKYHYF